MSGSPPQMETIGALHSMAESRHSSRLIMSLRLVEYSRMRPQPVQVRLQVCNGSSCSTRANLPVFLILLVMICRAIFADSVNGNLIVKLLLGSKSFRLPKGAPAHAGAPLFSRCAVVYRIIG